MVLIEEVTVTPYGSGWGLRSGAGGRHSQLNYVPPVEYEGALLPSRPGVPPGDASTMKPALNPRQFSSRLQRHLQIQVSGHLEGCLSHSDPG
jgi:hypothetical protein